MRKILGAAALATFVLFAALANIITARVGVVALPFGGLVTAGTFAAGAVLVTRDFVHDTLGRVAVVAGIVAGALVSGVTSPVFLAVASGAAFLVAELIDWLVYSPLRRRGWARAVFVSSLVAAPIDTVIFLWLAPFPVTLPAVLGQWVVKVALAALFVAVAKAVTSAVLRNRVESANA